jgi:hypothetical protein
MSVPHLDVLLLLQYHTGTNQLCLYNIYQFPMSCVPTGPFLLRQDIYILRLDVGLTDVSGLPHYSSLYQRQ